MQKYSVAKARDQLTSLIHRVERGESVELTRRGKTVAVLISVDEYERLTARRPSFGEAYARWLKNVDLVELNITPDIFDERDENPEREENVWLS